MSSVAYQPVETFLEQEVTYELTERLHLGSINPYLYCHNFSGSLIFSLNRGADLIYSKKFDLSDVKTALDTNLNYCLLFMPMIPDNMVQIEKGIYTLRIEADTYSYSANSFIGWCIQHEDVQNKSSFMKYSNTDNPLAFRVKEYKEAILCV